MELTVIHATTNCEASSCPTIYKDGEGNFVIQGFKIDELTKSNQQVPANEDMVKIPADFFQEFLAKMK